ncbi:membrane fusion protein [Plesiocystis pacifica SIR-1]|uniref:Membrane fusion protein n=1 Tax=Plesiocystis pacifica SIR-1 TaxID=391625 RepID=A6G7K0_9BACT|nr:efflux RND transporter periplasmic adaptor subunit [Plesiocystis pacifica]EDM78209.1 membrane fusion protein [Plesiocystis pacifica SIR-1]
MHRSLSVTRLALGSALLALCLSSSLACEGGPPGSRGGPGGQEGPMEEPEERATPVLLATVAKGTIEGKIRAASTIEAEMQVTVHAESTGRVTSLALEEGDAVERGQTLARIRRDAQSSSVDRANKGLVNAQREYDRVAELYAKGIASQSELDTAENNLELAKLDKRDRRRDLANTTVVAPFDGIITQRFVDEGGFVGSGNQVFEITDFDTLVARVYVPERELDRIAVGQDAAIVGKAAKGREGVGQVKRIAPIVDATTGTVKVTIGLPAALSEGGKGFLPGMYAEVTLTTEVHADIPVLPKPALVYEEEQTFVFIAEGDRAKKVLVETGLANEDFVEVLSGIEAGATIIVAGQAGLKDGGLIEEVDAKGVKKEPEGDKVAGDGDAGPREGVAAKAG